MTKKLAGLVILSLAAAYMLAGLQLRALDNFFLDWHQILLNDKPPSNPLVLLDISGTREGGANEGMTLSLQVLSDVIQKVNGGEPKAMILAFSPKEVEGTAADLKGVLEKHGGKNLYFFSNQTVFSSVSFSAATSQLPENQLFSLDLTHDSRYGGASRRILTHYGRGKSIPNSDFERLREMMGGGLKSEDIEGDFEYLGTSQVFMRIWPTRSWSTIKVQDVSEISENRSLLKDKIVLIGTKGKFGLLQLPSIFSRMHFFGESSLDLEYMPAYEIIANYMTNMYSGFYVKSPSRNVSAIWISLGLIVVFCVVLFAPPSRAFWLSSISILGYLLLGCIVFRWQSYEMDSARVVLVGLLAQYLVIPIRFHKFSLLKKQEKFEADRQIIEEKLKTKALVLAAASDAHLRISAKISHDIRSPLMALKMVGRFLGNDASEELKSLLENAISRIDHIAEDTLSKFRSGAGGGRSSFAPTLVRKSVSEIVNSFSLIYPDVDFLVEVPGDLVIELPDFVLQRCLSNLIQNSLDACESAGCRASVSISAQDVEDRCLITVQDNGPGIADEIKKQLFQVKATFGKQKGTGLGLAQVKSELEYYGAYIAPLDSASGAAFRVSVPVYPDLIGISLISRVVLILSSDQDLAAFLKNSFVGLDEIMVVKSIREARLFIEDKVRKGVRLTLISDLILESSDETAFDLLDSFNSENFERVILCTSLVDNSEIHALALQRQALLVSKYQLERLRII